jgi:hypothetical protein
MTETTAVLIAALGASALTAIATFGLETWRAHNQRRRDQDAALSDACVSLLGATMRLVFRARAMRDTMISRSGLSESLDILLHNRRPTDSMQLTDWLLIDLAPALDAQSEIWTLGGETLIESAATLVSASTAVVTKAGTLSEEQQRQMKGLGTRLLPLKNDDEVEAAFTAAVSELGKVRRQFALLVRRELQIDDVDALARGLDAFGEKQEKESRDVSSGAEPN